MYGCVYNHTQDKSSILSCKIWTTESSYGNTVVELHTDTHRHRHTDTDTIQTQTHTT